MKTTLRLFTLLILNLLLMEALSAQGCSDAGFCTINGLKTIPSQQDSGLNNQFKLGIGFGKADHESNTLTGFVDYHKEVTPRSSVDIRLTYIKQKNDLTSSNGLSDLFINTNWKVTDHLGLITGCKLALSDGNVDAEGQYLPMDFQHSLGTFDLILGIWYEVNGIQFYLAGQQRLNKSKNKFLAENYPFTSGFREYQSTNNYERSGDLMLRVSYPISLGNIITLIPSALPIYHLSDDKFTNAFGGEETILDSKGLTLNANLAVEFNLNQRNKISLNFATPLVTRKVRPDGLTRKYVAGLEYAIKF